MMFWEYGDDMGAGTSYSVRTCAGGRGGLFRCWRRRPDSTWVWISAGPHLMDLLSQQIEVYLQDYGAHEALKTVSI